MRHLSHFSSDLDPGNICLACPKVISIYSVCVCVCPKVSICSVCVCVCVCVFVCGGVEREREGEMGR